MNRFSSYRSPSILRVQKDLWAVKAMWVPGLKYVGPNSDSDLLEWKIVITGTPGSPLEDCVFKLKLRFPTTYPYEPPKAWFLTKMFHPNIFDDGRICADILDVPGKWSAGFDARGVIVGIQALLDYPDTGSVANPEAAVLFSNDPEEYVRRVQILNTSRTPDFVFSLNENLNGASKSQSELFLEDFDEQLSLSLLMEDLDEEEDKKIADSKSEMVEEEDKEIAESMKSENEIDDEEANVEFVEEEPKQKDLTEGGEGDPYWAWSPSLFEQMQDPEAQDQKSEITSSSADSVEKSD